MKTPLKQRLINVLKIDKIKFNRYIRFSLSIDFQFRADLSGADLSGADLSGADLSGADLSWADLSGANLSGANLDFGQWPLWCGSLKAKTDTRIRIQLAFHFASLIKYSNNATDEEKEILEHIKNYVNKFHRTEIERIK